MLMPGRDTVIKLGYRYRFNGKEQDNEPYGHGDEYDYGMRIYNPRIGRFLSVDPLANSFPWYTPYQYAGNTPIQAIDLDGKEEYHYLMTTDKNGKTQLKILDFKKFDDGWFGTGIHKKPLPERYVIEANGTIYYIGFNGAKGAGNNSPEVVALAREITKPRIDIPYTPQSVAALFYNKEQSWKFWYDHVPNTMIESAWTTLAAIERFPGVYNEYSKYTDDQLRSSIKNTNKTIEMHEEWIKNPLSKEGMTENKWNSLSDKAKEGIVNSWKIDIERNEAYVKIAKAILDSRISK